MIKLTLVHRYISYIYIYNNNVLYNIIDTVQETSTNLFFSLLNEKQFHFSEQTNPSVKINKQNFPKGKI